MSIQQNERWLLSLYRSCEIGAALFYGELARRLPPGSVQADMSRQFADESQHAWLWTRSLRELGHAPIQMERGPQQGYLEAVGRPSELMEALALTHVFERRTARQYRSHLRTQEVRGEIALPLRGILRDEAWHLEWVAAALDSMREERGAQEISRSLERFEAIDRAVYGAIGDEHAERLADLERLRRWAAPP